MKLCLLLLVVLMAISWNSVLSLRKSKPGRNRGNMKNRHKTTKDDTMNMINIQDLLMSYDRSQPPDTTGPTNVRVGVYVNSLLLDDDVGTMELGMYQRQSWKDQRLQFDASQTKLQKIRLLNGEWDLVWKPDIFCRNTMDIKVFHEPTEQFLMTVNSTGHVWYVYKTVVKTYCPELLTREDVSVINCPLMIESFGYTMDTMYFTWLDKPVDVDPSVRIPNLTLNMTELTDCSKNYTAGAFPCLEVNFKFK